MKKFVVFILTGSVLFMGNAFADCTFGENTYPEGSTIPGYTCKDGSWVPVAKDSK